ncbi:MAG: hypothetical protein HZB81_00465 [Deltaproteobacteria bacterium]|nr:hypothetical protein [Deltaproteobacteria bacterium]
MLSSKNEIMLSANNESELLKAIREIDVQVPLRSEGRTKEHTERYAIAHLLSALLKENSITYPVTLVHRDKPDFLLSMSRTNIGIEHTEAVPQNEAHKSFLREKGRCPDVYFTPHHKPDESIKKANQLIKEINANEAGAGWVGDSVKRKWADAINHFALEKKNKIAKDGFVRYDENWLLIYDGWPLPAMDIEKAAGILLPTLLNDGAFEAFNRIFVLSNSSKMSGKHFVEFSSAGVTLHEVNNLWN